MESISLLSDPFLQLPDAGGVHVVWTTESPGTRHVVLVGDGVADLSADAARAVAFGSSAASAVHVFVAASRRFTQLAEDAGSFVPDDRRPSVRDGIVPREIWRHEALVDALAPGERVAYRVLSLDARSAAISSTFTLAPAPCPGDPLRVLLTSDHQAAPNVAANLQKAVEAAGPFDAVFAAGDLANLPDRASEWFDDTRGSAFWALLQGRGGRSDRHGLARYRGGEIVQHAPLFPAVGNHDVQGRTDGSVNMLSAIFSAVPRPVAAAAYSAVAASVNPTRDPEVRRAWIERNSFNTRTYEEMFTLPNDSPGGATYYAVTFGDIRLITLFATRMWRGTDADADPDERTKAGRWQEAPATLGDPMEQGHGEHIFASLAPGSDQHDWLRAELASPEFAQARVRVVMLHEGPHGLGANISPAFTDPVRIEEHDDAGGLVGIRYEYPVENDLLRPLGAMLEDAGVDLVLSGHSHLWNRFVAPSGTVYLETSNVGNTHGAHWPGSGRERVVPPEPWNAADYAAVGDPGGLEPVVPSVAPFPGEDGVPQPYVQSNDHAVFSVLDTGAREVVTWAFDVRAPDVAPWVIDRFGLDGRP
ncbi:metallophosphoesterase [Microbacter sp. GSS18]|nr:metallophosphoesterase [Microbacter sp. GSS18]